MVFDDLPGVAFLFCDDVESKSKLTYKALECVGVGHGALSCSVVTVDEPPFGWGMTSLFLDHGHAVGVGTSYLRYSSFNSSRSQEIQKGLRCSLWRPTP